MYWWLKEFCSFIIIVYFPLCSELYAADADDKHIVPVIFEHVDYQQSQKAMGVKYVVGGLQPISFIPTIDDYSASLDRLVYGLKTLG